MSRLGQDVTAILRHESRLHIHGAVVLLGAIGLLAVFMLAVFPAMAEEAELIEGAFPDAMIGLFGFEELHTLEGFYSSYLFPLVWIVFVGIYFAYLGGGMLADDIEQRRMDLLLANPISREGVVLQKFGALWLPIAVLNIGVFTILFGGSILLNETVDPFVLAMTFLLSIPYLLVCAAIGLVFSAVLDRVEGAQAGALGAVFLLWLVDGLSEMNDTTEFVGWLTPSRYFNPTDIMLREEYAIVETTVLVLATIALVTLATIIFVRRDL